VEVQWQEANLVSFSHGARLDQADKSWHLTSPTPYDPPLTYGGWAQSRALGARIASLLQAREESSHDTSKANGVGGSEEPKHQRKKRKHNVIIHSSPFLRCLQTSIAISAGMAQFYKASPVEHHAQKHHHSGSPHLHADRGGSPHLSAIPEPEEEPTQHLHKKQQLHEGYRKNHLCVDAFLGEWLSPDYFENITPPPGSNMMVASAKAELLRRAEPMEADLAETPRSGHGHFPGGWGSSGTNSIAESEDEVEEGGLAHMASLGHALPKRIRASSHDSLPYATSRLHARQVAKVNTAVGAEKPAYVPPTPSYAISPSDPIPTGYVSHARDACVEVEFQWDSMREPQEWGNGGEYGEEWSAMHKRFRTGLQKMIYWYKDHEGSTSSDHEHAARNGLSSSSADHNDDTDTVLILVTHGAGCNALIGALTAQPVLLDVGMGSLTMAVRKDILNPTTSTTRAASPQETPTSHPPLTRTRKSSIDHAITSSYHILLVASTEHLRAGSNPLAVPQLQTPKNAASSPSIPSPLSSSTRRLGSLSAASGLPLEAFSIGDPAHSQSASRPIGSLHRSSSAAAHTGRPYTHHGHHNPDFNTKMPTPSPSGLWGSPTVPALHHPNDDRASETSSEDQLPNFGDGHSNRGSTTDTPPTPGTVNSIAVRQNSDADPRAPVQDRSREGSVTRKTSSGTDSDGIPPLQKGLWGGGSVQAVKDREVGIKRRWTVNEHH
jgi:hypothetical protein